jgi:hypothetical protein
VARRMVVVARALSFSLNEWDRLFDPGFGDDHLVE